MNEGTRGRLCVLFVDDEPNILAAIKRELHSWALKKEIEVLSATSARAGIEILEAEADRIAVLCSDLRMPERKGSDFLLEVRERWPEITAILLTGFSETEEIAKAVKAGISSFILKPWEPAYLQAEVEKALDSWKLRREHRAWSEQLQDELRWAGEMQRAMLHLDIGDTEGVEFKLGYHPVANLYCGGDYYDIINLSKGRWLVLIGDVAGHGVKAAFVTGILKAIIYPEYIKGTYSSRFSPSAFLSWLNARMDSELSRVSGFLLTFFAGVIDLKRQTFTYSNAGQTRPYLLSGTECRELAVSGPGIGMHHDMDYPEASEAIAAGDLLFFFTDGLVERGGREGACDDFCLPDALRGQAYGPDFQKRILDLARESSGRADFEDDVTLLTARIG
jgi:sigma-B regulation protein RsbU (phosphoserine phosphatase)